jgi:hypothetical protein
MVSTKKLVANRANAKKSTGPKSAEGKARSSLNSWKHGLTAERILIVGEDAREFETLCAELMEEWKPKSRTECALVERMAVQFWRLAEYLDLRRPCWKRGNRKSSNRGSKCGTCG